MARSIQNQNHVPGQRCAPQPATTAHRQPTATLLPTVSRPASRHNIETRNHLLSHNFSMSNNQSRMRRFKTKSAKSESDQGDPESRTVRGATHIPLVPNDCWCIKIVGSLVEKVISSSHCWGDVIPRQILHVEKSIPSSRQTHPKFSSGRYSACSSTIGKSQPGQCLSRKPMSPIERLCDSYSPQERSMRLRGTLLSPMEK